MKRLLTSLVAVLLIGGVAMAAEDQSKGTQSLVKNDNKANITFMKQPLSTNSTQKATIERNWFCITVINNGKTVEVSTKNEK